VNVIHRVHPNKSLLKFWRKGIVGQHLERLEYVKFLAGNVPAKFEVRIALPIPEIIAIEILGRVANPQILGKGRP